MKEPKAYLLPLVTGFLILIVGMMLSITIYLYIKNQPESPANAIPAEKSAASVHVDSLSKPVSYPAKKQDSITSNPTASIEQLREEINALLADQSVVAKLEANKKSMEEIRALVSQLQNKNKTVLEENEVLNKKLQELKSSIQLSGTNYRKKEEEPKKSSLSNSSSVQIESAQLKAICPADLLNKETTRADQTEKLFGSLIFSKKGGKETNVDLIMVVTQPDGTILQESDWDTGIFYTNSGKQIYTRKIRLNVAEGEPKKIDFTLQADKFIPGKYSIAFYYMGSVIRTLTKVLS